MYEGVGFALLILYYYHDYIHTETKLFNFQRIFKNGGGGGGQAWSPGPLRIRHCIMLYFEQYFS